MTTYFVIAAVRIQQWLLRTPDLYLTRGASKALVRFTSRDHVSPRLAVEKLPLQVDPSAPDVAGVIVLTPVGDLNPDDTADLLKRAALLVADDLPGVEWRCWCFDAASYLDAVSESRQGALAEIALQLPPRSVTLPLLQTCDGCHGETALKKVKRPDGTVRLGADCLARNESSFEREPKTASDFDELSSRGGLAKDEKPSATLVIGRRDADNHLATIAADGNRIGAFFKAVADNTRGTTVMKAFSEALDASMRGACGDARLACLRDRTDIEFNPDIVHYVGGDDVLATVGARFAWQWAVTLSRSFQGHFGERVDEALKEARLAPDKSEAIRRSASEVTLAIGMAFANRKHPFDAVGGAATSAEHRAKRYGRGTISTLSWIDLTVESSVDGPRWISADQAARELEDGHRLKDMSSSATKHLQGMLRLDPTSDRKPTDEEILDSVSAWADRTNNPVVHGYKADGPDGLATLRADLDRTRWWPVANKEES